MRLDWDIHELVDFGRRVGDTEQFYDFIGRATKEIAAKFHKMLIYETPVDFGNLQAHWQTQENYSYMVERKRGGLEVTLINKALYAVWVNDGHKQRPGRFIPGYWEGSHFRYDPKAKGGMVLKKPWVKGRFFVETSVLKMENSRVIESIIQKELKKWFRWCLNG